MDLRTQTSLIAGVLSLAIVASVVMRSERQRVHWLFGAFGTTVSFWYFTTFLGGLSGGSLWPRVNLICAIALPLAAVQFFRVFIAGEEKTIAYLNRGAFGAAAVMGVVVLTPAYDHIALNATIFIYVLVMLVASLAFLYSRGVTAGSRFEGARLKYLAIAGALAATFTLADYLPYVGLDIPPVGTVLTLVFLYVLSQSILRYRLLDLYELAGRLGVLTALSFTLAIIFWVLVELAGGRFFLHSVVAALVVLLLFDPVRVRVEEKISQFFFRERYDLERTVQDLRSRLVHVLELEDLTRVLLDGLERSRRVTHAAIYLVDEELRGYDLAGHVGPDPARRIELAPARPLLDRLRRDGGVVLETLERDLTERRATGEDREAETLYEITQTLDAMHASACLAVSGEHGEVYGLLTVRDERLRDAFSPEEVQLLGGLASQAAIAVENSRLYERMKERDRLAALGEMAAGLAHEIRNPLGAIKASAQFLEEPVPDSQEEPQSPREFLDIIVEEVDRLNRVVSSFLDYARPSQGDPSRTEVNGAVTRTMQLLGPECNAAGVQFTTALDDAKPSVRIDVEQLRQVLINLVRNAVQAMESGGELGIETGLRERPDVFGVARRWVEIRVNDTGPGVPRRVLDTLFVPFVTTKDRGTGLGLAISQRIVSAAGGHIEVRSHEGVGSTFVIRLPAAEEPVPEVVDQIGGTGESSDAAASSPEPSPEPEPRREPDSESDSDSSDDAESPSSVEPPSESPSSSEVADPEPDGAADRASTVATSR